MKGFGEIVIGAGGQAFDDLFFMGVGGEKDDIDVELLEVLAYALAEFNAADVGHRPVRDHQGWLMFGEQVNRLTAVLREQNSAVLFGERLLDEFAIYRRIIRYENLEFRETGNHSLAFSLCSLTILRRVRNGRALPGLRTTAGITRFPSPGEGDFGCMPAKVKPQACAHLRKDVPVPKVEGHFSAVLCT